MKILTFHVVIFSIFIISLCLDFIPAGKVTVVPYYVCVEYKKKVIDNKYCMILLTECEKKAIQYGAPGWNHTVEYPFNFDIYHKSIK